MNLVWRLFACLVLMTLALMQPVSAQDEHNPLDILDQAKSGKHVCDAPRTSWKKTEDEPKDPAKNNRAFYVEKGKLLKAAFGKNGLSFTSAGSRSFTDVMVDQLVPCNASPLTSVKPRNAQERLLLCYADSKMMQLSATNRYSNKEAHAVRQNLLRLFQSGLSGGSKKLLVVRNLSPAMRAERFKDLPSALRDIAEREITKQTKDLGKEAALKRAGSIADAFNDVFGDDAVSVSHRNGDDLSVASSLDTHLLSELTFDLGLYKVNQSRLWDDAMLIEYLYAEDETEPFPAYCRKRVLKPAPTSDTAAKQKTDKDKYIEFPKQKTPPVLAPDTVKTPFIALKEAPNASGLWDRASLIGRVVQDSSNDLFSSEDKQFPELRKFATAQQNTYKRWKGTRSADIDSLPFLIESKRTRQLRLLESPDQFIEDDPSGANFGTELPYGDDGGDSGDTQLTATATLGYSLKSSRELSFVPGCKSKKCAKDASRKFTHSEVTSLTPYLAIDQSAQDLKFIAAGEDGTPETKSKSIALAKYAAGIRLDYKVTEIAAMGTGAHAPNADQFYRLGTTQPGTRGGVFIEVLEDNYNIASATRFGAYYSPPARIIPFGLGKWYGRSYPADIYRNAAFDVPPSRPVERSIVDDAMSGWFLSWDARGVVEYLDYSRAPRDFEANPIDENGDFQSVRLLSQDKLVEFGNFGADLSLKLAKHNFLSLGKDDLAAELSAKYTTRAEFDDDDSLTYWELGLKLQDPTAPKKRHWEIKYYDGEHYFTGTPEDRLTFNLVFGTQ